MPPRYSTADLLARCRDYAQLPADDEQMTDAKWYRLLTDAQQQWHGVLASHVPGVLLSAPRKLETDDGGRTFRFGDDLDGNPLVPEGPVQVFRTERDAWAPEAAAVALVPEADFQAEGALLRLRLPTGLATFPEGAPWVRWAAPPGEIDAAHEPTLLPVRARELVVLSAVAAWASWGDLRSGAVWEDRAHRLAWGDPARPGDVGLVGALKLAREGSGAGLVAVPGAYFWGNVVP